MLPACPHLSDCPINLLLRDLGIRARDYCGCLALGSLQNLPVADQIRDQKTRQTRLLCTKKFARAPQFEIEFGDLKSVAGAHHGIEPLLALFGNFSARHQNAKRFGRSSSDSPAQLVKL